MTANLILECFNCSQKVTVATEEEFNKHLDECLTRILLQEEAQKNNVLPENDNNQLLKVKCPYPNCKHGNLIEANLFPKHAFDNHSTDPQNYSCPICELAGFSFECVKYTPTEKTNLLSHISKAHSEFLNQNQVPVGSTSNTFHFDITQYNEYVQSSDSEKECPICWEEFHKNDVIKQFACFCAYHKTCIDTWIQKSNSFGCVLHKNSKEQNS